MGETVQVIINKRDFQAFCLDTAGGRRLFSGIVTGRRRVSYLEPTNLFLRLAFRALRFVGGDDSRLAAWTRTWRCQFVVDFRAVRSHCYETYRGWSIYGHAQAVEAERRLLPELNDVLAGLFTARKPKEGRTRKTHV